MAIFVCNGGIELIFGSIVLVTVAVKTAVEGRRKNKNINVSVK